MNCGQCRPYLLEAAPAEIESWLAATGGSGVPDSVGAHLADCAVCRRAARRIVTGNATLAESLATVRPPGSGEAAAKRAAEVGEERRRASRRRLRNWGVAAVLAALLAVRSIEMWIGSSGVSEEMTVAAGPGLAIVPEVEAMEGRSVAVFETEDPNIVVFWFYEGREE